MNWEPARSDHSIDRVVASISLLEPIGADDFDQLVLRGRQAARDHRLVDRVDLPDIVAPPRDSGGVIIGLDNFKSSRRVVFRRRDVGETAVEELSIGTQQLSFTTLRYRRWPDFYHLITSTIAALDPHVPISQTTRLVRLEYVDRFQSAPGGADHFEIISKNSMFLAPIVKDKTAALHVHSGWIDFESQNVRKLTNINIDVNDISVPLPPPVEQRRKISILSMGQFEAQPTIRGRSSVLCARHRYGRSASPRMFATVPHPYNPKSSKAAWRTQRERLMKLMLRDFSSPEQFRGGAHASHSHAARNGTS